MIFGRNTVAARGVPVPADHGQPRAGGLWVAAVGQLHGPPPGDPSWHPDRRSDRRRGVGRCCGPRDALACREAFAEVRRVVVVDDERPGQHGLEVAGEAALGTPREVVPEVVALGPLRESGDVIRVVIGAFLSYWGLSVAGGVLRMMMRVTILPSRTVR